MYDRHYYFILFLMFVIFIIMIYRNFLYNGWFQEYEIIRNVLIVFSIFAILFLIVFIFYDRVEVWNEISTVWI